jgi:hypothetical protein
VSCSVHDVTDLEARGLPAVYVATEAFVDGAERQAKALGFDPAVVFVSHPIQDRTDDEMRAIAERAFAAIVAGISLP